MGGTTARAGGGGVRLEVVHEPRLRLDSPQPRFDRGIVRELDAGVARDVGVGIEADVRDGVVASEEEVVGTEVSLEDVERMPADLLPALDERLVALRATGQDPEAPGADVRLEQVLLEEEPLRGTRPADLVAWQERRALAR